MMVATQSTTVTDVGSDQMSAVESGDPVNLVVHEQLRMIEDLMKLPRGVWTMPSKCEGWSIARVVAHLSLSAEIYRESVIRALEADAGPPRSQDGRLLTIAEIYPVLISRQEALAAQAPTELVNQFAKSGGQLVDLFASLLPADMMKPAWHPSRTISIGAFVAFRVFELGLHGWDIRASVDPEAVIRRELCAFLLGFVRQAQMQYCRPDPDLDGSCRFVVNDQTWTLRVNQGTLANAPSDIPPEVTIRTDAGTYVLLATKRRSPAEARAWELVDGDPGRAELLLDATGFRI
jgi:uncharacterized protein (TIGR03083 family)